jgi:hypothetical protein
VGGCFLVFVFGLGCFLGFFGSSSAVQTNFSNMIVACHRLVVHLEHVETSWLWQGGHMDLIWGQKEATALHKISTSNI